MSSSLGLHLFSIKVRSDLDQGLLTDLGPLLPHDEGLLPMGQLLLGGELLLHRRCRRRRWSVCTGHEVLINNITRSKPSSRLTPVEVLPGHRRAPVRAGHHPHLASPWRSMTPQFVGILRLVMVQPSLAHVEKCHVVMVCRYRKTVNLQRPKPM
jgi:hypothetical protein